MSGPQTSPGKQPPHLVLGIDIGTTTVKVCLVSAHNRQVSSLGHGRPSLSLASELGPLGSEQDVHKICTPSNFACPGCPKSHWSG
ncbi:FGGY_N domain-containing protein [Trichonephila clavata]|uniref:FGGY_N domain-containing protein n=1 Tax=Trichonephila clavata TaxID=2740835 RepID=A0A8X6JBA0_TRICU|nr:FGGY_N domain-containing protein [Trichonephila clavata]